jgi:hypothetical protein
MKINNTSADIVARYARNHHREEFVARNPGIPEEVLVVVYFRRTTNGRWWYAPPSRFDPDLARYVESAPMDAKWYEIPVCPNKISKIKQDTREKYMALLYKEDRE